MCGVSGFRLTVLGLLVGLSLPARAESDPVPLVDQTLTNPTTAAMVDVRIGSATIARVEPGASVTVQAESGSVPQGRFELSAWGSLLGHIDLAFAGFHLRTAGFFLDAIDAGQPGAPMTARNTKSLRETAPEIWRSWLGHSEDGDRLVAYAARYMNPALTVALMGSRQPNVDPKARAVADGPLADLGSFDDLLRVALEVHGRSILTGLIAHPLWAKTVSFDVPALALGFEEHEKAVIEVLGRRTDLAARSAVADLKVTQHDHFDGTISQLSDALEGGDEVTAARLAVRLALFWRRTGYPDETQGVMMVCGGLDGGARLALKAGHLLAAEGYLILAGPVCGDERPYRSRVADYMRRMGDSALVRQNLVDGAGWYRAALWFSDDKAHRARLADTLAEQALLAYQEGLVKEGGIAIEQARAIDAFRPKVLAISEAKPTIDPRARYALMVILVVVGFFAVRRLRRALGWSSPKTRPVRK